MNMEMLIVLIEGNVDCSFFSMHMVAVMKSLVPAKKNISTKILLFFILLFCFVFSLFSQGRSAISAFH
jgi:hypothetical protein